MGSGTYLKKITNTFHSFAIFARYIIAMRTSKYFFPFCLLLGMALLSCRKEKDLSIITEIKFENALITSIETSDAWTITIVRDTLNPRVELSYSAYLQDEIVAMLDNDELHLSTEGAFDWVSGSKYEAIVYVPSLQNLNLSEATSCEIEGAFIGDSLSMKLSDASVCVGGAFRASKCRIELSDASEMADFNFDGNDFSVEIADASRFVGAVKAANDLSVVLKDASSFVNYSGLTQFASIDLDGSSTLNMIRTEVKNMNVALKSASSATVFVSESIEGELEGASTLYYKGNPTVDVACSESSSVVPI
jgi:Protein of unknown function (DUF2807).